MTDANGVKPSRTTRIFLAAGALALAALWNSPPAAARSPEDKFIRDIVLMCSTVPPEHPHRAHCCDRYCGEFIHVESGRRPDCEAQCRASPKH